MRVSRQFFFCTKRFHTHKKHKKHKKHKTQASDFHSDVFMHMKSIKSINSIKSTKRQTNDFLLLRCFYAHKNAVFFVSHTKKHKKHKKHIKSIKTQISEQATFFPLDVF